MNFEIVFWDVQHGSSTYIVSPNFTKFLIDLGTGDISENNLGFSPVYHLYRKYSINYYDELIITHPDLDHIADIKAFESPNINFHCLLRNKNTDNILNGKIQKARNDREKQIFQLYKYYTTSCIGPVDWSNNPMNPNYNSGVEFKVFAPKPDISNHIENNQSLVLVIKYNGVKFLITGDNEKPSWNYLLDDEEFINAIDDVNIFLVPHHGRESGFCEELFEFFKPELCIISDGPVVNTSVVNYGDYSFGYEVNCGGQMEPRYSLTTRKDGRIKISVDNNGDMFVNTYL